MSKNQPSHRIFAVSKPEGADKATWREIGAAWPHKNGAGFSLKLKTLPAAGEDLAMRAIKARTAPTETFEAEVGS